MKAIPTTYAHIKFRSRLEARWAVFFDALDVAWEYEPERARVPGLYYAPDFLLASVPFILPASNGMPRAVDAGDIVVEVKPANKTLEQADLRKCAAYVNTHDTGLLLLRGSPACCECDHYKCIQDNQHEVTHVQWGILNSVIGLYVLSSKKAPRGHMRKPWKKYPVMAQAVFEACHLGSVGEARQHASQYKFPK